MIKKLFKFNWLSTKFFLRLFLILIAIIISLKIAGISYITDTMALGAMGFISTLIGLDKLDKKIKLNS